MGRSLEGIDVELDQIMENSLVVIAPANHSLVDEG